MLLLSIAVFYLLQCVNLRTELTWVLNPTHGALILPLLFRRIRIKENRKQFSKLSFEEQDRSVCPPFSLLLNVLPVSILTSSQLVFQHPSSPVLFCLAVSLARFSCPVQTCLPVLTACWF